MCFGICLVGGADPWTSSTYSSGAEGSIANTTITISGVGKTMQDVAGHALVVRCADAALCACL